MIRRPDLFESGRQASELVAGEPESPTLGLYIGVGEVPLWLYIGSVRAAWRSAAFGSTVSLQYSSRTAAEQRARGALWT